MKWRFGRTRKSEILPLMVFRIVSRNEAAFATLATPLKSRSSAAGGLIMKICMPPTSGSVSMRGRNASDSDPSITNPFRPTGMPRTLKEMSTVGLQLMETSTSNPFTSCLSSWYACTGTRTGASSPSEKLTIFMLPFDFSFSAASRSSFKGLAYSFTRGHSVSMNRFSHCSPSPLASAIWDKELAKRAGPPPSPPFRSKPLLLPRRAATAPPSRPELALAP
mmetsp:Transcript_26048/g.65642  ORF Transcript_26048/g.65642 Transcript_26048/m.65642 type:complete len:221 (-) Transcript_26048:499-1161(-)